MVETADNKMPRRDQWLVVLIPASILRLTALFLFNNQPVFQKYLTLSRLMIQPDLTDPFFSSPVYSAWIYLLAWKLGLNVETIRLIQFGLGILAVILVTILAARLFGRNAGIWAGLIYGCLGSVVIYEGDLVTASLVITVQLIGIWFCLRACEKPGWALWVITGLVIGISTGIRPNMILIVPLCLTLILFLKLAILRKILAGACFVAGFALAVSPITLVNFYRTGEFITVTASSGNVFYSSNNFRATGLGYSPPESLSMLENEMMRTGHIVVPVEHRIFKFLADRSSGKNLTYREMKYFYFREGWKYLGRDIPASAGFWFKKGFYLFNRYDVLDTASLVALNERLKSRLPFLPGFGFVAVLGIFGILYASGKKMNVVILLLFLAPHIVTGIVFYVNGRLRTPMASILAVFAGYAVTIIVDQIRNRNPEGWLTLVILMGLSGFVSMENETIQRHREVERPSFLSAMKGLAAEKAGDDASAVRHFVEAVNMNPLGSGEACANLAAIYSRQGKPEISQQAARHARGIWDIHQLKSILPNTTQDRKQLKRIQAANLWRAGRRDAAETAFMMLHLENPFNPDLLYNLAIMELQRESPDYRIILQRLDLSLDYGMKFSLESVRAHEYQRICLERLGELDNIPDVDKQRIWELDRLKILKESIR